MKSQKPTEPALNEIPQVVGNYGVFGSASDGTAGYFENDSPTGYTVLNAVGDNASSRSFVSSNRQTGVSAMSIRPAT